MNACLRAYEVALARRPLLTQMISAGILASTGDIISQLIIEKNHYGYNPVRTARFFFVAGFWAAPVMYPWFRLLEGVKAQCKYFLPIKKMLLDQIICAPSVTSAFITLVHLLEYRKPEVAIKMMKEEIMPVMISNYKVWPLIQVTNFTVIPLRYRIAFVQFIGIFWNAYLSHVTQAHQQKLPHNI